MRTVTPLTDKEEGELSSDGECAEFVGAAPLSSPSNNNNTISNAPTLSSVAAVAFPDAAQIRQQRGGSTAAAERDRDRVAGKNSNEKGVLQG